MMPRRGSSGVQALVLVAVLLMFIYGYYSFNELKNTLKQSEETAKRVKLQQESVSAQLQAISEQKNQLEESIRQEKTNSQNAKDEFARSKADMEAKHKSEKSQLGERLSSLTDELEKLKDGYEALQAQQKKHDELDNEHANERAKLTAENNRLKQETRNEIAVLKDQIADLKRQNDALKEQARKNQPPAPPVKATGEQQDINKVKGVNALSNNNQLPRVGEDGNQIQRLNHDIKPIGDANDHEVRMQIKGPLDRKQAYFEPREAKPDHPVVVKPVPVVPVGEALPHADQVIPPNVEPAENGNIAQNPDAAVGDEEEKPHSIKRGVMARPNGNSFGHQLNPIRNQAAELHGIDNKQPAVRQNVADVVAPRGRIHGNDAPVARAGDRPQHGRDNRQNNNNNNNNEEDQLQGPAMHNEQNGNERDDAADADEDDDYHYEDNRNKAPEKEAVDGPHAAPVDEDEENKDGGL